ncbi:UNVERIFIED_CONTAM: Lrfn4 [Trichonephila clavipes]
MFSSLLVFNMHKVACTYTISIGQAGDPCPPKAELDTCTCTETRFQSNSVLEMPKILRSLTTAHPEVVRETAFVQTQESGEVNNSGLYTEITCKGSRTVTTLQGTIMFALHRKLVDKLVVSHVPGLREHTLVRLPAQWLKNTRIRQFEIWDTVLSGDFLWHGSPFDGQGDTLMLLSANRCSLYGALSFDDIGTVHTKGLNLLPHLQGVNLSFNHLTIVKATAFRTPPANLTTIIMSHNSLQILEPGSFQYVTLLKCIDLSHNLLENIVRSLFASPAKYLESIDLSWNFLRTLPIDFFVNMPALRRVNLSKNFLHSLPEKPWGIMWKQLTFLDLSGNFIDCDCSLLWLLSVLSPTTKNSTTTPAPKILPGQRILAECTQNSMPGYYSIRHDLTILTRKNLMC